MDPVNRLSVKERLCYGVGHVLNDICASMWFTYLLVFFHLVLQFDSTRAGVIMLIGQVADALSTPFVGYFSDSNDDHLFLCRYGKRKAWHLVGTLCVIGAFPFIFNTCIHCEHTSLDARMVYYGAFIVIFQFGWAAVQISHLALIPDLTPNEHQRTKLTSLRSSFSVLSNILVYVATFLSLRLDEDRDPSNQIGPKNAKNFERVVYFGLAIGAVTSLIFHAGTKEPTTHRVELSSYRTNRRTLVEFLKDPKLYQVAIVYTCSRLFVNLSQVYVPLYLHETLSRNAEALALVPLVMFLSSFSATTIVNQLNRHLGRVMSFIAGACIGIGGCVWILLGSGIYFNEYEIYVVALLLGFGGSIMLVTTLGFTADLIGPDTDSGAFVYGSMSFADKLINGVAIMIVQKLKCDVVGECPNYYRDVLSLVCGCSAVIAILNLFPLRHLSQRYSSHTIEPNIGDPVTTPDEPLIN